MERFKYILVRALGWILGILPYRAAQRTGSFLGRVAASWDTKHVKRAAENIRLALSLPEDKARRLALDCYRHQGMVVAEFFQLARMKTPADFRKVIVADDAARLRSYIEKGPGAVAATGHFGNWEYTGQISSIEGMPPSSFIKHLGNPHLDAFVAAVRERWGTLPLEKSARDVVMAVKRLREGNVAAVLCDQHADEGIETTFFGRRCKTVDTAARIALKTGAPMVPVSSFRRENGKHEFVVGREIPKPAGLGIDEAARVMTEEMNRRFEEIIRRHPEQWLWTQRRHRI